MITLQLTVAQANTLYELAKDHAEAMAKRMDEALGEQIGLIDCDPADYRNAADIQRTVDHWTRISLRADAIKQQLARVTGQ